jgi:hypothetical protein
VRPDDPRRLEQRVESAEDGRDVEADENDDQEGGEGEARRDLAPARPAGAVREIAGHVGRRRRS